MHAEGDVRPKLLVQQWRAGLHGLFNINSSWQWLIIDFDQVARIASRVAFRLLIGEPSIAAIPMCMPILSHREQYRPQSSSCICICRDYYSPILFTGTNRLGSACTHLLGSMLDSSHDVLIACAAADIALESLANLFFCWIGIILEQLIRGHNHTRRAEAALQTMLLPEALLDWMQTSLRCKSLNGCHFTTIRLHCQYRT